MKRQTAFLVVLCLGLSLPVGTFAQGKKVKAKNLFNKGVAALEEHDYKTALEAFTGAYETSPHWMVLAHIGTCHAKLNNPVKAINALETFLEDGGSKIADEEANAAKKLLAEQRRKVGVLHLVVKPRGAEAKIDGDSIGKAPFDRILLKAGPHHIMLIDGDDLIEKDVDISAGKEHTVRIPDEQAKPVIAPVPAPEPEPEDEPLPPEPEEPEPYEPQEEEPEEEEPAASEPGGKPTIPFAVALGIAGAGLITGGVGWGFYGYYANSEQEHADAISGPVPNTANTYWEDFDWIETCHSGDATGVSNETEVYYCNTERDRRDFADKSKTSIIPAVIGTGVFVLAGGTAILFYFYPEWFPGMEIGDSARFTITPLVDASHTGLMLGASF